MIRSLGLNPDGLEELIDKIGEIWPTSNMSLEEKINAITRLIILLMIVGYLITLRFNIIIIGLISILSMLIIYSLPKKNESFENNSNTNTSLMNDSLFYENNRDNSTITHGPFKYCAIKILIFLDPTHPVIKPYYQNKPI